MKLEIKLQVSKKLRWWMNSCNMEWSGVAYYKIKEYTKTKFPELVELVYFHVLDIGSHSSTEWNAESLAKAQNEFLRRKDINVDDCFQGLIHSHHTMGAFVSSTDQENLDEHAPLENFYFSLIVSTKIGKEYVFATSWTDNFGFVNSTSIEEVNEDTEPIPEDWINEVKVITARKRIEEAEAKKQKVAKNTIEYFPKQPFNYSDPYAGIQDNWMDKDDELVDYDFIRDLELEEYQERLRERNTSIDTEYWKLTSQGVKVISDLDLIDVRGFEEEDEDFYYEDTRKKPYTSEEKIKIIAIRDAIKYDDTNWHDINTWCKKNDININEFTMEYKA